MTPRYDIAIELNRSRKTMSTRRSKARMKGGQTRHTKFVQNLIREVAGIAPYEKRAISLIRMSKDKSVLRFLKCKLGTYIRAKKKYEKLSYILSQMRRAQTLSKF